MRPVLLYRAETFWLNKEAKIASERLSYLVGDSLAGRVLIEEVTKRCGVRPVVSLIRENRQRWFERLKRRKGKGLLGEVMGMGVPGRKPPGR